MKEFSWIVYDFEKIYHTTRGLKKKTKKTICDSENKQTKTTVFFNPLKSGLRKKKETKNKQMETPAKTDIEDFFFLSTNLFIFLFVFCFLFVYFLFYYWKTNNKKQEINKFVLRKKRPQCWFSLESPFVYFFFLSAILFFLIVKIFVDYDFFFWIFGPVW